MPNGRDTLRIVTLSAGGRTVPVLDLNDATGYWRDRDAGFNYTPAAVSQQVSRRARRYGGGRVVGEVHDNGSAAWTAYVRGSTLVEVAQRVESLLEEINSTDRGRYLEWAPDGLASSFIEIAGPGSWQSVYDPLQLSQAFGTRVQISFPALPLVRWAPMTILDPFNVDSLTDYTFDASTSGDVAFTGSNYLAPVVGAALSAERRARHTIRGYTLKEGQATLFSSPGTTITSHKSGVLLRASSSSTYVEVYVDDNGTNSRLRIDVVIAGVRTNRASTNLASRIAGGARFAVRGRIIGNTVTAEYFFDPFAVSPMGAPTTTNNYTLTGGESTSLVAGYSGWSWVPQHAAAQLDDFAFLPFTYRNLTLPVATVPADQIPGSAPALVDVLVTPSGGSATPRWAMVAWARAVTASTPDTPGVYDAEFMTLTGWGSSVQAGSRNGNDARATTSGAGTFTGVRAIAPTLVESDDFTDIVALEVWARVIVSSTLVNPRLAVYVGLYQNTYSVEYGSVGKLLAKPSSGTVYRFVRLGMVPVDTTTAPFLGINGSVEAGSSGVFGIDYLVLVPSGRRAAGMTGVASAAVTSFVPSTSEVSKLVRSDLSAVTRSALTDLAPPMGEQTAGLGGALIQPSPGVVQWLVKLSSLVPDDPTVDTSTEQLAHSATVSLNVVPRSFLLRDS